MTRTHEHVILSFFGWVQFNASNAVIIIISIKSKAMNLLVEVVFLLQIEHQKQSIFNLYVLAFAQSCICISYSCLFMLHWPCGERDHSRTMVLLGFTSGFSVQ